MACIVSVHVISTTVCDPALKCVINQYAMYNENINAFSYILLHSTLTYKENHSNA